MNSYVEAPIGNLVDRTLSVFDGDSMVFFLGAGASVASPSFMPQPPEIQALVFECVAPEHSAGDRDVIAHCLPEIYHEALLEVGGASTREIWRVLSLWETPPLSRFGLGPNLVHKLTVYLSWKTGVPVVTVNFDEMLERAATELGLTPDARLTARPDHDMVAIWKLHGTIEDLHSIRTTVQGITAVDRDILTRVEREFSRSTGCLIGYSGRDIDFFPFLCGWRLSEPVWWLSLGLRDTAIRRFPDAFVGVDARAEEWAQRVVERMPITDPVAERLRAELDRPHPDPREIKARYHDSMEEHARRVYAPTFPRGDPKRVLAHAMALAAIGKNRDADQWAGKFLSLSAGAPTALSCRAELLKSAMAHEFARYADSRDHARQALTLARRQRLQPEADEATLRIDEAQRMLFLPPRLPFARASSLLRPKAMSVITAMLIQALRLRRYGRQRSGESQAAGYADLRATFEYLEHLVRIGAISQGWIERLLPPRTAHRILSRYWRWIEERSYSTGYAMGIGNAKKYQLRRTVSGPAQRPSLSVLDLYELIPSPTGTCIHHRDAAEALSSELAKLPPGPAHERKRDEARVHFQAALAAARQAGDPSLELKTMLGIKRIDHEEVWSPETVRGLLENIQSPAFKKFEPQLVAFLTSR